MLLWWYTRTSGTFHSLKVLWCLTTGEETRVRYFKITFESIATFVIILHFTSSINSFFGKHTNHFRCKTIATCYKDDNNSPQKTQFYLLTEPYLPAYLLFVSRWETNTFLHVRLLWLFPIKVTKQTPFIWYRIHSGE